MKISVICPTYNSERFVEKTIKSVFNQTKLPNELILIDDGSTDNTIKVLESVCEKHDELIETHILKTKHKGPGAARNMGIKKAKSEWIAFLDSDDIWHINKIERVIDSIKENKEINFICHHEMLIRKNKSQKIMFYSKNYNSKEPIRKQLYYANFFSTSAVVCKKNIFDENGYFDESLQSAQDYELWLRLSSEMNVFFIKEVLGEYIERIGNITSGNLRYRLLNEIKIAIKHRHGIPKYLVIFRFIRILLSYSKQLILRIF